MKDNDNNTLIGNWGRPPVPAELERCSAEGLIPCRVVRTGRGLYSVAASGDIIMKAEVSGAFRYRAVFDSDYPAIGDWAACRTAGTADSGSTVLIEWIFSRSSTFSRKIPGERTEEQVMAANIDIVLLVFGLNGGRNFSPGAVERYLSAAWESGARPVIVLNKADLCTVEQRQAAVLTTEASAPGVEVITLSAQSGEGLDALAAACAAAGGDFSPTVALAGPSGVGKSTIINALAGTDLQRTGAQRESDLRGRHTTTERGLFRLDSGLLLIDSPGLRELQLWSDGSGTEDAFTDISEIAAGCRYDDCRHTGEPGCAVQAAVASGELEQRRYENYLDLMKELDYLQRRKDEHASGKQQKRWKDISKDIKRYYKERGR